MRIAFFTHDRVPATLPTAVASLHVSDVNAYLSDIVVYVDAIDLHCVRWARHHKRLRIEQLPDDVRAPSSGYDRLTLAEAHALANAPDDVALVEDDVVFRDGWVESFRAVVERITKTYGSRYVLSAYSPRAYKCRSPYTRVEPHLFYGTQFLYVPRVMKGEIASFLREHVGELHNDLLIGRWAQETGSAIFTVVPGLVQHVGQTSALGSEWHCNPEWP